MTDTSSSDRELKQKMSKMSHRQRKDAVAMKLNTASDLEKIQSIYKNHKRLIERESILKKLYNGRVLALRRAAVDKTNADYLDEMHAVVSKAKKENRKTTSAKRQRNGARKDVETTDDEDKELQEEIDDLTDESRYPGFIEEEERSEEEEPRTSDREFIAPDDEVEFEEEPRRKRMKARKRQRATSADDVSTHEELTNTKRALVNSLASTKNKPSQEVIDFLLQRIRQLERQIETPHQSDSESSTLPTGYARSPTPPPPFENNMRGNRLYSSAEEDDEEEEGEEEEVDSHNIQTAAEQQMELDRQSEHAAISTPLAANRPPPAPTSTTTTTTTSTPSTSGTAKQAGTSAKIAPTATPPSQTPGDESQQADTVDMLAEHVLVCTFTMINANMNSFFAKDGDYLSMRLISYRKESRQESISSLINMKMSIQHPTPSSYVHIGRHVLFVDDSIDSIFISTSSKEWILRTDVPYDSLSNVLRCQRLYSIPFQHHVRLGSIESSLITVKPGYKNDEIKKLSATTSATVNEHSFKPDMLGAVLSPENDWVKVELFSAVVMEMGECPTKKTKTTKSSPLIGNLIVQIKKTATHFNPHQDLHLLLHSPDLDLPKKIGKCTYLKENDKQFFFICQMKVGKKLSSRTRYQVDDKIGTLFASVISKSKAKAKTVVSP